MTQETVEETRVSCVVVARDRRWSCVGVLALRGRASSVGDGRGGATPRRRRPRRRRHRPLALSPAAQAKNPVKVAPAELAKLAGDIQVVGTVAFHEDHFAVVGPLVPGRISKLVAGVGDKVKRGQVIAEIESERGRTGARRVRVGEGALRARRTRT